MRFHRLTVTAFGPYAHTQTVNFEELNEAGVFLVTGPTGAGKTSILDAICFALYGVVPGVRDVKTLRSHHAAAGIAPEVVLEVTVGDRRYRVRRSPEWMRPKKRGEGETRENARATLVEVTDDGAERLLSSRVAEVGHELAMAIGMSSEQFMQVVLLPQGEFQEFLRASSDERQSVLERLFRTQRFARIEEWMRDRTKELALRAADGQRQVAQLLATIAHRAGSDLPEELTGAAQPQLSSAARQWSAELLEDARNQLRSATDAETAARAHRDATEESARSAHRLASSLARRARAEELLRRLDESEPEAQTELELLGAHERSAALAPLLHPLTALDGERRAAAAERDRAAAAVDRLPAQLRPTADGAAGCRAAERRVADRLAALRAVLPRERALAEARAALARAEVESSALAQEQQKLEEDLADLPGRRAEAAAELATTRAAADGLEPAREALAEAARRSVAAAALPAAREAHTALADRLREARDHAGDARERHLDIVERRLAGMAAELAGQLSQGAPCIVCGSEHHPSPASLAADAVTEADQRAAAEESDRLRTRAERLATEVQESVRSLHELELVAGGLSAEEGADALERCRRTLARAQDAVDALPTLEERAEALHDQERALALRLDQLRDLRAAVTARVATLTESATGLADEVAAALDGQADSVEEAIELDASAAATLAALTSAHEELGRIESRHGDALASARTACLAQGFAEIEAAREALLPPPRVEELRSRALERADDRRTALATLADEEVAASAGLEPPDLAGLDDAVAAAAQEWQECAARRGVAEEGCAALTTLAETLDEALTAWEPHREQHATADSMTQLVRGMGTDNQLQMRLSSYVLATRLDQVLEAANERLSHMRDHRYTLRRCGRTRGNSRAGLGLEVLDAWTGEARAPSTLSGGETFVVSLALALGLADVVTQESGGLRVDTLFVDEGFGMLDPDTLDDVMDRIDALRAGGRTVGVVSHVTELRGRIPTQLHVTRSRTGSTVAVRTLVA